MIGRRILLLGANGQLGWALQRALAIRGDVFAFDRCACDLADPDRLRWAVRETRPDIIVNAAAYTAVDRAESEPDLAHRINAAAPAILAEEARAVGALFVHYSTDYVFDGEKPGFYVEADEPRPLCAYGRSKLAGEKAVQDVDGAHLIFRTSWVCGLYGKNFPKTILNLAKEHDSLRVVADQMGAPTSVDLIADVTAHCADKWFADDLLMRERGSGLYHLAASGETSWHGLACEIVRLARAGGLPLKLSPEMIEPIATSDYPTAARRPANSCLATKKFVDAFRLRLPPWQLHIQRMISEIGSIRA